MQKTRFHTPKGKIVHIWRGNSGKDKGFSGRMLPSSCSAALIKSIELMLMNWLLKASLINIRGQVSLWSSRGLRGNGTHRNIGHFRLFTTDTRMWSSRWAKMTMATRYGQNWSITLNMLFTILTIAHFIYLRVHSNPDQKCSQLWSITKYQNTLKTIF